MNHESDIHGGFSVGKRENCMEKNRYGFTLAELLVVVAIIGVLVGVSIPIFAGQLEKAREATDIANVRSAYSEVMSDAITENHADGSTYDATAHRYSKTVQLKQKVNGWQTSNVNIAGITSSDKLRWQGDARAEGDCEVIYEEDKQSVLLNWGGYTIKNDYQWHIENGKLTLQNKSSVASWPASAIPNSIDAKLNTGQQLVVGAMTDATCSTLLDQMQAGYNYEIGYFITKPDGTIIVDHGYTTLTSTGASLTISTDNKDLGERNSGKLYPNVSYENGEACKVSVQFFKIYGSHGTESIQMTAEEAAELSRLISYNYNSTSN